MALSMCYIKDLGEKKKSQSRFLFHIHQLARDLCASGLRLFILVFILNLDNAILFLPILIRLPVQSLGLQDGWELDLVNAAIFNNNVGLEV